MAALLVVPWAYQGVEPSPFRPGMVSDVVFSIAATFVFVSLTSIAQLIGPNVLASLLTGRYYHPREEQRIVLFLDLVGSTGIAERHRQCWLPRAALRDLHPPLPGGDRLRRRSAPLRRRRADRDLAARHARGQCPPDPLSVRLPGCVGGGARRPPAPAWARSRVSRGPSFGPAGRRRDRGLQARDRAARRGDEHGSAARAGRPSTGHDLLASQPLLDRTLLPAGIVATSIGSHLLRGKSERLELFALERGTRGRVDRHDRVALAFADSDAAGARTTIEQIGSARDRSPNVSNHQQGGLS